MTARSLFDSLPARNTRLLVGQSRKFFIVNCILQALGIPLVVLMLMLEIWEDAIIAGGRHFSLPDLELYIVVGVICVAAATVLGIPAGICAFQELWKRSKVDMIYSLPLTGRQRYFSHYLSGCTLYLMPYTAAVVIGWIIVLLGCAATASLGVEGYGWAMMGSTVCRMYAMGTIGLLLLMWMYYTAAVLFASCTGTLFENVYTNILFNLLVPGTLAAVIGVITSHCRTMNFNWYGIDWTSPIGGLIYLFMLVTGLEDEITSYLGGWNSISGSEVVSRNVWTPFLLWGLRIILFTAVLLVLAWQLYVRRKAEQVSKPFPYKAIYFVMLTMITVLILCLVTLSDDLIGPALLLAAIVYLIMEIIRKRGFKRFWVSILSYAGTAAAVLVMLFVVDVTNCFSQEYTIPPTFSMSSVRVDVESNSGGDFSRMTLEYTNRDVIEAIHSLQKEVIGDYKENGGTTVEMNKKLYESGYMTLNSYSEYDSTYSDPFSTYDYNTDTDFRKPLNEYDFTEGYYAVPTTRVVITYTTTLGGQVKRTYSFNPDQYLRLMEIIHRTDLYAQAEMERVRTICTETKWQNDDTIRRRTAFTIESLRGVDQQPCDAAPEMADRLAEAYYADLQDMSVEDLRESGLYCRIGGSIPVWNCNTRTRDILRELGFAEFTLEEQYGFTGGNEDTYYDEYNDYTSDIYSYSTFQIRLYKPGSYMSSTETYTLAPGIAKILVDPGSEAFTGTIYGIPDLVPMLEGKPELRALLEAAKDSSCFTMDEDCWLMNISGRWYYIEPENAHLAEAYMESYDDEFWNVSSPSSVYFGGSGGGSIQG